MLAQVTARKKMEEKSLGLNELPATLEGEEVQKTKGVGKAECTPENTIKEIKVT